MIMLSSSWIENCWYSKHPVLLALVPFSWCYELITGLRRCFYRIGILPIGQLNKPVIVVGNISVGGTGKTPLVIYLCRYLKAKGLRPGIISRGYGATISKWPQHVKKDSDPAYFGDEPVLLARRTDCPVVIDPMKLRAATMLIATNNCDVIICDDGLQHYALARDIEIAVVDGIRRHGNNHCLPAGPLREPVSRLDSVDMIVNNGESNDGEFTMHYEYKQLCSLLCEGQRRDLVTLSGKLVHAVAAIGNPERFFSCLRRQGLQIIEHKFRDHYPLTAKDINFDDDRLVIMTEKDAIKCTAFATQKHWFLPIEVNMPKIFTEYLSQLLEGISYGQKAT